MTMRVIAALFCVSLLGGCTDSQWDNALHYVGLGPSAPSASGPAAPADETAPAAAPAPAPAQATAPAPAAPAAPPPGVTEETDVWCRQIAKAARVDAAGDGFDTATQDRREKTAYEQCLTYRGQKMQ